MEAPFVQKLLGALPLETSLSKTSININKQQHTHREREREREKLKCYCTKNCMSLTVGLWQPTGHWFSMPVGRCRWSLITVGHEDQRGTRKCAITFQLQQEREMKPHSAAAAAHYEIEICHASSSSSSPNTISLPKPARSAIPAGGEIVCSVSPTHG